MIKLKFSFHMSCCFCLTGGGFFHPPTPQDYVRKHTKVRKGYTCFTQKRRTQTLVYVQRRGLQETLVPINSNFWRECKKELEHLKHCKRPFLKIMFKVPLKGTPRSSQAHLISKAKPPPPPLLLLQFYQGWYILRKRDINLLLLPILTTSADGCFALCVFLRGHR